jgi:hypothetical protein
MAGQSREAMRGQGTTDGEDESPDRRFPLDPVEKHAAIRRLSCKYAG